jgi:3-oxoacyl-[acyl-carrier protein] reductase
MSVLEGRVAVVTGAAVGIGREIAVALGREGAHVVVNFSRSASEAEETRNLVAAAGGTGFVMRADVSDDRQVRAMVARTVEELGHIDVLVNNAGITVRSPFADLEALTDPVWERLYAVNVLGMFNCCRAVVQPMRQSGGGKIINIGSISGVRPTGSSLAYCASKAAMMHLSSCLALALAPEVAVNVLAPGFIDDTRWNADTPNIEALRAEAVRITPAGRLGVPPDVAQAAVWLATAGTFITGAVIAVDGGRHLAQ